MSRTKDFYAAQGVKSDEPLAFIALCSCNVIWVASHTTLCGAVEASMILVLNEMLNIEGKKKQNPYSVYS